MCVLVDRVERNLRRHVVENAAIVRWSLSAVAAANEGVAVGAPWLRCRPHEDEVRPMSTTSGIAAVNGPSLQWCSGADEDA